MTPKSDAPILISGVLGDIPPNRMHFGVDIQNAYLTEDTMRNL